MYNNLSIKLFGNVLDNPIIPASGTFGFGYEFAEYYDINILASIALKGTTYEPRYGNILPRIAECQAGMINAIGLQNPGAKCVVGEELVKLSKVFKKTAIANVAGNSIEEYVLTSEIFDKAQSIMAIELNISCPNVKGGGMHFGTDPKIAAEVTKSVKSAVKKPVIVKLSPNVSDITEIARAVEGAGADAISLINTLSAMRIDLKTAKPIIGVGTGGYSGAGIFPIAIKMVAATNKAVKIPIIGMGGITNAYDVIEMMYAGARAVMVGTQNLIDPFACKRIIEDLPRVMKELKIEKIEDIIGRTTLNG
ncbi:MAG: dihydroorotate dehydrogenase [Christensenellaceae bacterium]|jgi:dihydroorotate dehydrogenase (NAD+) catalytic subunit|nr:dihydroorotate dehydrogenase [Christensenellaceae bacterium]